MTTSHLTHTRRGHRPAALFALVLIAGAMVLGACAQNPGASRGAGAVVGGVAGGLLGSQVGGGTGRLVATGVGAALGAFVGSEIGAALSEADRRRHQRTIGYALEEVPSGQTSTWQNPDVNRGGAVTPTRNYQEAGRYCREYRQSIYVGNNREQAYGTACRRPDGSWEIVS